MIKHGDHDKWFNKATLLLRSIAREADVNCSDLTTFTNADKYVLTAILALVLMVIFKEEGRVPSLVNVKEDA